MHLSTHIINSTSPGCNFLFFQMYMLLQRPPSQLLNLKRSRFVKRGFIYIGVVFICGTICLSTSMFLFTFRSRFDVSIFFIVSYPISSFVLKVRASVIFLSDFPSRSSPMLEGLVSDIPSAEFGFRPLKILGYRRQWRLNNGYEVVLRIWNRRVLRWLLLEVVLPPIKKWERN